jgi:peptidoglycan-associated lipoprotein
LLVAVIAIGCSGTKKGGELSQDRVGGTHGTTTPQNGEGDSADRGEVDRDATGLRVINFDFDRYDLREDARRALDYNAEILRANAGWIIMIEGHCDERGTNEYNLALGERRAKASKDYLVRLGIDAARIAVISYGEERPKAMGHDESAWSQNRRAEFVRTGGEL